MSAFINTLRESWRCRQSLLCVGLDPDLQKLPPRIRRDSKPLYHFNREIIDATAQWVCAYKPQIACYAALAAEDELAQTIDYIKSRHPTIPVILDAKRGDIGSTAKWYAREAFERYAADAVTVNPYLGGDSIAPFLDYADKGVFILCRTSNPGSADFQTLSSDGQAVCRHVAMRAKQWNANGNVGLVVGATWPDELGAIRKIADDMPILVPGIGAQGGDLAAVLANGQTRTGDGLMVNVSRAILYAGQENFLSANQIRDSAADPYPTAAHDFAEAAARAAQAIHRQINSHRP